MLALVLGALLAIDPERSTAAFSVQHVLVERVEGKVPILKGSVELPNGSLVPSRVSAVLDATKLKTDDEDRDGALQTSDWFDTAKFPTWAFDSTKITPAADGFTMAGMLTIHGVTREETLTVVISGTPMNPAYHATCKIDRHAFGMKTTRMDAAIGGLVDIVLDIHVH